MPMHSSRQPSDQDASPDLDLAFEAATDVAPELLAAAGAWADPLAGAEPWHALFTEWLNALAAELPPALQSAAYSLGLSLVGDAEIAALNAEWRQKEGPTDVLAFAAQDPDLDGTVPMPLPPQEDEEKEGDNQDIDDIDDEEDEVEDDEEDEDEDDEDDENDEEDEVEDEDDEDEKDENDENDEDDENQQNHDTGDGCEPLELGDIVISLDTAARQASDHSQSLVQELQFLASHGLLHLLGWDHPDAASLEAMLQRQDKLLRRP